MWTQLVTRKSFEVKRDLTIKPSKSSKSHVMMRLARLASFLHSPFTQAWYSALVPVKLAMAGADPRPESGPPTVWAVFQLIATFELQ